MTTGRQSLQENFIMTRCLPVLMLFAILTPCLAVAQSALKAPGLGPVGALQGIAFDDYDTDQMVEETIGYCFVA